MVLQMASADEPRAARKVFGIAELLKMILLTDGLTLEVLQSVNRNLQDTITGSNVLQYRMGVQHTTDQEHTSQVLIRVRASGATRPYTISLITQKWRNYPRMDIELPCKWLVAHVCDDPKKLYQALVKSMQTGLWRQTKMGSP